MNNVSSLSRTGSLIASGIFVTLLAAGCGSSASDSNSAGDNTDALIDDLLGNLNRPQTDDKIGPMSDPAAPVPAVQGSPVAASGTGELLKLRLQPGDRFPLIKTTEQTLIQRSEQHPAMAQTKLELGMTIDVREVHGDAILMSVSYSRVSYMHDINGQRVNYDSDTHQGQVPEDVIPYAGMVNNGFSFWLGRDNRIRELVDYNEFLQRCVQNVPAARRQSILIEISTRFGDDGVASFVDDTIGVLPYNTDVDAGAAARVVPGDVWTRERRLMQPVPIHLTSTYRLLSLDNQTAEIDITGRIAPGEMDADGNSGQNAAVKVLGGQSIGSCIVDRSTGLPLELKRTRFLNMEVTTEDNHRVAQDKQIVTSIRAFPRVRGPVAQSQPNRPAQLRSAVRQASARTDYEPEPGPATVNDAVQAGSQQ